jgi:hypothetical protein
MAIAIAFKLTYIQYALLSLSYFARKDGGENFVLV